MELVLSPLFTVHCSCTCSYPLEGFSVLYQLSTPSCFSSGSVPAPVPAPVSAPAPAPTSFSAPAPAYANVPAPVLKICLLTSGNCFTPEECSSSTPASPGAIVPAPAPAPTSSSVPAPAPAYANVPAPVL